MNDTIYSQDLRNTKYKNVNSSKYNPFFNKYEMYKNKAIWDSQEIISDKNDNLNHKKINK